MTHLFILTRNPKTPTLRKLGITNTCGCYIYNNNCGDVIAIFCKEIWEETGNYKAFKNHFIDVLAHEFTHEIIHHENIMFGKKSFSHYGINQMHIHDGMCDLLHGLDVRYLRLCNKLWALEMKKGRK
jgi:hypothetical protein